MWVMPPISGNALYNAKWVGVSDEGFNSPSTRLPARSMTTISAGVNSLYGTPEGFMTNSPCSRSMADTLPQVSTTKL